MEPATLVRNAKAASKKSYRALAAQAEVATSTVMRIEAQQTQPTTQILGRILASCGFRLELGAVRAGTPIRPRLRDLTDAWSASDTGQVQLDWTRWRAWLDELAIHPEWVSEAIYPAPPPAGHPVIDALLAAIAEKLADDSGLVRPSWTEAVPQLDQPFRPPRRRAAEVPMQLEQRRLLIDAGSLFRPVEQLSL